MKEPHAVTRRTIVKGAAWSVPVIAAVVATPLAAASTAPNPCNNISQSWFADVNIATRPIDTPTSTEDVGPDAAVRYIYDRDVFPTIRVEMTLTFTYLGEVPLDPNNIAYGSYGATLPGEQTAYGNWQVVSGTLQVLSPAGTTAIGFSSSDPLLDQSRLSGAFRLSAPIVTGQTVTVRWETTKSIADQSNPSVIAADKPAVAMQTCGPEIAVNQSPDVSYRWSQV